LLAAADVEGLAGDVGGEVAGEVGAGVADVLGIARNAAAGVVRRWDSEWKYSRKLLLVFPCRYIVSGAERQSLAVVSSGFRRVQAFGGVSGMPPV
jgi:hypothetical protein